MSKKQHGGIHRKLALRRRFLGFSESDKAAYVPFIGDGDIAVELYQDRYVFGVDIDKDRVAVARQRIVKGVVVVGNCDKEWSFPSCEKSFSLADFDAYANPCPAIAIFWERAHRSFLLVLFGSDTRRQAIKRTKRIPLFPSGYSSGNWRRCFNFYWMECFLPWLVETIGNTRIIRKGMYVRRDTVYWGVVIDDS